MDWVSLSNITRELAARMADASVRAAVLAILALLLVPLSAEAPPRSTRCGHWF